MNLAVAGVLGFIACSMVIEGGAAAPGFVKFVYDDKFLFGDDKIRRWEYVVGERVTLTCDISNAVHETVYWGFDNYQREYISQEDYVIRHRAKYSVQLDNSTNTYTMSWIAEIDDSGKYFCRGNSVYGIHYDLRIKLPADKTKNVNTNSGRTSQDVANFAVGHVTKRLQHDESVSYNIDIDAGCTWPADKRVFTGDWFQNCNGNKIKLSGSHGLEQARVRQNMRIQSKSCYQIHGIAYRYRDVFGYFSDVKFDCSQFPYDKKGDECLYTFEVDHYDHLKDQEPVMQLTCGKGLPTDVTTTTATKITTAAITTPTTPASTPGGDTTTTTCPVTPCNCDCSCQCPLPALL